MKCQTFLVPLASTLMVFFILDTHLAFLTRVYEGRTILQDATSIDDETRVRDNQ